MRIFIIKRDHITQVDFIIVSMVEIGSSWSIFCARPPIGMYNQSFFMNLIFNFPDLFEANTIVLRIFTLIQFIFGYKLLPQMTTTSFSKDCVFSFDINASFKSRFLLTIQANSHVTSSNSNNSIIFIKNLASWKSRKDLESPRKSLEILENVRKSQKILDY